MVYRFVNLASVFDREVVHLPTDVMTDLVATWKLTGFSMLHKLYLVKANEVDKMRDSIARVANDLSQFSVRTIRVGMMRGSHPGLTIYLEPTEDWANLTVTSFRCRILFRSGCPLLFLRRFPDGVRGPGRPNRRSADIEDR